MQRPSRTRQYKTEVKTKLEKGQTAFERSRRKQMLVGVKEELANATSCCEQSKPECVDQQASYEERVKCREEEIEG